MHACDIVTRPGKSAAQALFVGHSSLAVPEAVATRAAAIAKGETEGPQMFVCEGEAWLVLGITRKPWLSGGEEWRKAGADLVASLRAAGLLSCTVHVQAEPSAVQALVEGALLGDYRYTQFRSGTAAQRKTITLRISAHRAAVQAGIDVGTAQNQIRLLADGPGNLVHPRSFVATAQRLCRGSGLRLRVTQGLAALKRARFPGLVQVGQAGSVPPALLEMHYQPKGKAKAKTKKGQPPKKLALVGKGITFDAGGISLKPGEGMWMMKGDMSGAAAVLGAMLLIAKRKPNLAVSAYCALAENMPDRDAQRPGDIYQARNGIFVHVDNTDAEGRLVLADVLTYAAEQGATHMVDVATLTGACIIALGHGNAALMGNDEAWVTQVQQAGQAVGEPFWPLPLYGEYASQLEHPHADLNNIGGRPAGTITAGLFLSRFVPEGVKWAHGDIAGTAMQNSTWRYYQKGMTGFACRTLAQVAEHLAAQP